MSAERLAKSHVTAWVLVVVAVPVLYLLTFPAIERVAMRQKLSHTMYINAADLYKPDPKWFTLYAAPYRRLKTGSLKEPLQIYETWASRAMDSF